MDDIQSWPQAFAAVGISAAIVVMFIAFISSL